MHDKLDSLISYITNLQSNLEKFNPTELRGKMIPLLEELVPHLRHELDTLSPEKLSPHLGYEEMVEMNKMIEKMLQSYDSSVVLVRLGSSSRCLRKLTLSVARLDGSRSL